jgi:RNA polymerase sigma factor (sigma-70 family)
VFSVYYTRVEKKIIFIMMAPGQHTRKWSEETDEDLLNAYRITGDQQALAALYLRYTELVYGTAMKYLKDAEQAKDTVMNIYQELVTKLPGHSVDNFKSWLYVVVKNHCLMLLRKGKKAVTVEFQPNFVQSEDFSHLDTVLEKEKNLQLLEACIEGLSDEQKRIIRLFYMEEKCYNEITARTGLDWNKVRSLVQNGRRNLKICMEKNND